MYSDTVRRVYAYVRRRSDEATAESVVSEVFLKAWKHGSNLTGDPLPWLLVTAKTTLYDHWRREGRRQRLAAELTVLHREDLVTGIDEVAIDRAALKKILLTLAPDDREALLLVGWDGLSQADAAVVAGCSLAAFKARVNRARPASPDFSIPKDRPYSGPPARRLDHERHHRSHHRGESSDVRDIDAEFTPETRSRILDDIVGAGNVVPLAPRTQPSLGRSGRCRGRRRRGRADRAGPAPLAYDHRRHAEPQRGGDHDDRDSPAGRSAGRRCARAHRPGSREAPDLPPVGRKYFHLVTSGTRPATARERTPQSCSSPPTAGRGRTGSKAVSADFWLLYDSKIENYSTLPSDPKSWTRRCAPTAVEQRRRACLQGHRRDPRVAVRSAGDQGGGHPRARQPEQEPAGPEEAQRACWRHPR